MTTKYRINWRAIETGATGHGEPVFVTRRMAESTASSLNATSDGLLTHWVEAVEVAEEEQCPED